MNEPANHIAVVDKFDGTWIRFDEYPDTPWGHPAWGPWVPITDGLGYNPGHKPGLGEPRPWDQVDPMYAPFYVADPERTAWALDMVRREASS